MIRIKRNVAEIKVGDIEQKLVKLKNGAIVFSDLTGDSGATEEQISEFHRLLHEAIRKLR